MNKKGFMMAELVVVSSVVLVTLVGLYTSYNRIYSIYKTRVRYYDVVTLYRLGYYRDILYKNDILDDVINASNSGVVDVYNSQSGKGSVFSLPESERLKDVEDLVYMVNNNGRSINRDTFAGKSMHITFLEYVDFLEKSVDFSKFNHMLISERCTPGDNDSCSYAYLEIFGSGAGGGGSSGGSDATSSNCSLTINGTTIKATYKNSEGGISYYGFNSDKTGENEDTKDITGVGTYTFYVVYNDGNESSCSGEVVSTEYMETVDCGKNYKDSNGCYYFNNPTPYYTCDWLCNGTTIRTEGVGTCPYPSDSYCSQTSSFRSGWSCPGGTYDVTNSKCKYYTSGTTVTSYECDTANGYTKLNNNYCWKSK